jgi:hypothetical protein
MDHIGAHLKRPLKKDRRTERGELMRHFCDRLNRNRLRDGFQKITMSHMGKVLEKIPTKDLYYLKSVCDNAADFSKRFWWELDPERHTKEAYERAMQQFRKK